MMRYLYSASLVLLLSLGHSQDRNYIDSLQKNLDTTTIASKQLMLLNKLGQAYRFLDSAKTFQYTEQAMRLAKELKDTTALAEALVHRAKTLRFNSIPSTAIDLFIKAHDLYKQANEWSIASDMLNEIGIIMALKGDYDSSFLFFSRSKELREQIKDTLGIAGSLNNIGILLYRQGKLLESIEYYLTSLKLMESINNARGQVEVLTNIGLIQSDRKDFESAQNYYARCLRLCVENDLDEDLAILTNNMGSIFLELNKVDSSLKYQQWSYALYGDLNDKCGQLYPAIQLANIYLKLENIDSAIYYLNACKLISPNCENSSIDFLINKGLGEVEHMKGNYESAEEHYALAFEIAQKTGFKDEVREVSLSRYINFKDQGNLSSALKYLELVKSLGDSLYTENLNQQFIRQESEYLFKKEKDSIQFANRQALVSKNAELKLLDQERKSQRIILVGLAVILLISIIFSTLLYRNIREKTKINKELMALNDMKKRFFSVISHDIRAPINVMIGFSNLIVSHMKSYYLSKEEDQITWYVNALKDSSDKLLELMDGLLKWALKEEKLMPYYPEVLPVNKCIEENIAMLKPSADAKNILLHFEKGDELKVWADYNSLMSILRNLISNALKFTSEGGKVVLSVQKGKGDTIKIHVTDTGVGIPQDKLEKLFIFHDAKSSRGTKGEQGAGLGLNLVYDFVQMNQGHIEVESEVNQGTTFTVTLPSENHAPDKT